MDVLFSVELFCKYIYAFKNAKKQRDVDTDLVWQMKSNDHT